MIICQKMKIKSVVALYFSNIMFHVAGFKIIRDNKSGQNAKTEAKLRYRNGKHGMCSQVLIMKFLMVPVNLSQIFLYDISSQVESNTLNNDGL